MNKTQNYQLNQWEAEDKVQRIDFNADNAKIDAAIKAVDAKVDGKADQTALEAEAQAREALAIRVTDLVFGSYTGDGAESRTIPLGRTPKAVLVFQQNGLTYNNYSRVVMYGGLTLEGMPMQHDSREALKVVDSGFWVSYTTPSGDGPAAMTNINGKIYYYIAMV